MSDYNEKFEKGVMFGTTLFMILAIIGVIALVKSTTPTCRTSVDNYCGHDSGF